MRVLISAYACEPGKGSEPAVGWNWVRQIARFADAWVLTRANNRPAIEQSREEHVRSTHWVYLDLPYPVRRLKKLPGGIYLYYVLWQLKAYMIARRLCRQQSFDVVHHVTFVNYWLPSFLAFLPIPFVWGPVGGGESTPAALRSTFSLRGNTYELLRDFVRRISEWNPFVRATARRAALALATTPETQKRLGLLKCRRIILCSQVAVPLDELRALATSSQPEDHSSFVVVSIGRLLYWKGFQLGVHAFAALAPEYTKAEYWIIGSGPERLSLERLAKRLGVERQIKFLGQLDRREVLNRLSQAQVLLHPSLHDSGGGVCVEAMAAGVPVICLDTGGPALQISGDAGIRIPIETPRQVIADITAALRRLMDDRELLGRLSRAARSHAAADMTWEGKGKQMASLYANYISPLGAV